MKGVVLVLCLFMSIGFAALFMVQLIIKALFLDIKFICL